MDTCINTSNGEIVIRHVVRQGLRERQEDRSCVVHIPGTSLTLCAIEDGIGGQIGGELTAEVGLHLVCSKFLSFLSAKHLPALDVIAEDCLRYAQIEISKISNSEWSPGSTGLVGILGPDGSLGISWLGDSLAVSIEEDSLRLLTLPHNCSCDSEYRKLYPTATGSHLTRFLGATSPFLSPGRILTKVTPNKRVVMGSDGIMPLIANKSYSVTAEKLEYLPVDVLDDNASLIEIGYKEVAQCKSLDRTWFYAI
jgi:serine/threonine protein phosphatase PrpC